MSFSTYTSGLNAYGIVFDNNNNLYIANSSENNIIKVDILGNKSIFASGFNFIENVVFDNIGFPNGYLYVMDATNTIYKVNVNGFITTFITNLNTHFIGMVFDKNNNLYYSSNDGYVNNIYKIDNNGNTTTFIDGIDIDVLLHPRSLAFDTIGNLFVTNIWNNYISKYDSNGNLVNGTFISASVDEYYGSIIIDKNNNIYASIMDQYLNKYDSNGNFISTIYSDSTQSISGLAVDSIDNLYFTNDNGSIITKYTIIPSIEYTASYLRNIGFSISDLKNAGYTDSQIIGAGYTDYELYSAGYTDIYLQKVCKTCTDNSTTDHVVEYKPLKTMRRSDNMSQKMKQAAFIRRTQNTSITQTDAINFRFKNL